ncbi:MAG TPA: NADH-quinone oxidoreductase subunit N [Anaerolineales bacterium]|jgi:NADH-quinone oxidoreductase subunit N|nr:NADH-quinone oxidoreductase subunit N [Anaerolineales bacterium]
MSLNDLLVNLNLIMPLTVLTAWACVLLLVDLFIPKERKGITALLAALGLLVALALVISRAGVTTSAFNGMIMIDGFATFMSVIFLFSGLAGIAVAYDYLVRSGIERGEYYVLLLFSIVGMMLMAAAADLIMVFLALELLSIPLYVLAGIAVPRPDSEEAALKYFLLGAFASGFFLYGTALVYGATGSTALTEIVSATSSGGVNLSFLVIGAGLILVGLGFKVAVVPFHMWTPDVYQGAPSSVTAFMAVGAKAAGFAALLRIFVLAFPPLAMDLTPVLWALAAFTMVIGNVIAIAQRNIKRMLAYSSIAHAGYIMMALVPYGQGDVASDTVASALFYLLAYMLTSFAAWAVVIALEHNMGEGRDTDGLSLEDYSGLGQKQPALAAAMTIAMLSFIGIPPTLGFVGKFYLLRTVIEGGFPGLALIGLLTSLVSAYYYLRVVVYMYMRDGEPVVRREPWLYFTALATAVGVVVLSIFSEPLFNWASQAVLKLI